YPVFEHMIDGASDCVCRSHEGLCGTKASFHTPIKRAQRTVRAADRLRCHTEGLRGTVAILHGAALEDLATGDIILWREAQPRAKVLLIGPLAHIRANLGEDRLRNGITDAVDGDEVDTRNTEDVRPRVDLRGVLTVR